MEGEGEGGFEGLWGGYGCDVCSEGDTAEGDCEVLSGEGLGGSVDSQKPFGFIL